MIQNLLIALALAMDCFAVSVVSAVIVRRKATGIMLRLAFLFGFFQALMPLIGWLLTSRFSAQLQVVDHWVAFGMLAFIGGKMIVDSFKKEEHASMNPESWKTGLLLAVATSIDALAVGISYACTGYETLGSLVAPLITIGIVSFLMSILGYLLGVRFGDAVNRRMRPELLGGIILICIGLRILAEHMGLLAALAPLNNVPAAPDYTAESAWFTVERGASADIFYISSTETDDYTLNGKDCHFANAVDTASCAGITAEMKGVDSLLSGNLNYYSPYYRQITMESYTDSKLMHERILVAEEDIRAAFQHYLKLSDRPFVLAGFSQGAQLVVTLLEEMTAPVYERLVAAYVIGWNITKEELESSKYIVPAQGATDTGVTISYNSVRTPDCINPIISGQTAVAINPVNWRTDETPAHMENGLTAHLDTLSHNLLVDGYTDTDYIMLPYFPDGCYHKFEIPWYHNSLRQNIQDRVDAYFNR